MRVIHRLRKYDVAEWGGTETAVQRLFEGLHRHDVTSLMYCPRVNGVSAAEPRSENGSAIKRFKACVPIWGISRQQRQQLVAVGGNLMSFDLMPALWRERDIALIHAHTLGRLGSIACAVARARRLPFVVTIHGGLFDLPEPMRNGFQKPKLGGCDWGKLFGMLLRSRQLLSYADAILTCNPREAALITEHYPNKRVQVQPHGIPTALYERDSRAAAYEFFPELSGRRVLLCVGRIDPVKNQGWLIEQAREILRNHPGALLVLAGACTDQAYGEQLRQQIRQSGLEKDVLLTGALPPADPRLIGLFQIAETLILPSISETFGLVLLEAWAAGTAVISSRTSGASALIRHGENGWLFDLQNPASFHEALDLTLENRDLRARLAAAGHKLTAGEYDVNVIAGRVKQLYQERIESKHALCNSTGR